MNITRNDDGRDPGADPQMTDLLRHHYAAPLDEHYWSGLEARVMQGMRLGIVPLNELRPSWWSGFGEFRSTDIRTAGLIAATIGLLVAGATYVRKAEVDATARELAQRAAVESALPLPLEDATLTTRVRVRLPEDAPERYLHPLDY